MFEILIRQNPEEARRILAKIDAENEAKSKKMAERAKMVAEAEVAILAGIAQQIFPPTDEDSEYLQIFASIKLPLFRTFIIKKLNNFPRY